MKIISSRTLLWFRRLFIKAQRPSRRRFGGSTNASVNAQLINFGYYGVIIEDDIKKLVDQGVLIPPPDLIQYRPTTLHLTIGAIVTQDKVITHRDRQRRVKLKPGGVASVLTREELNMPLNVIGTAVPIHGRTEAGLLMLSGGHIDAGYKGVLSVELINMQKTAMPLEMGMPIIQVIFLILPREVSPYSGGYKTFNERLYDTIQQVYSYAPAAFFDIQDREIQQVVRSEMRKYFGWTFGIIVGLFAIAELIINLISNHIIRIP